MPKTINLRQKNLKGRKSGQKEELPETIKWVAPEFVYYPKSKSWFTALGLIAAALFLWALFGKNFLYALLVGLSYFVLVSHAIKKPREVEISLSSQGVRVDKTLYNFENLRSFWIFYDPPKIKELSLRSKKMMMPYIKAPLGEENPVLIRQFLIRYLPEKRQQESLIDIWARNLRF